MKLAALRSFVWAFAAAGVLATIGCGSGPKTADEDAGNMDDMSEFGAPADPAALSGEGAAPGGAPAGDPGTAPATP